MSAPVYVKRTYARVERHLLYLVIEIGGQRCRWLPLSKIHGGVHNGGTISE